jgi:hypothetical protein
MKTNFLYVAIGCMAVIAIFFGLRNNNSVDYSRDVKPILNQRCISCHGGVKQQGEFSVLFEEEAFQPAESGTIPIIKGDAKNSEFYKRLISEDSDERMPYKEAALPQEEIEILKQWINEGAEWGEHWAFQPPKAVIVPNSTLFAGIFDWFSSEWGNNEIDNFIKEKLDENDLKPSPEAEKRQLARRAALDLIGVPASEKLVSEFVNNNDESAYEAFVDSLLISPQFGEKWAGMWLDLARFSDTKGYEKDEGRSIWRYRDYLIQAFNDNMPYDQFIVEQLAGDLLPNPTDNQLIATAFHRNTMNNDEGGTEDEEYRTAAVVDRVNTTWEALQGTTFSCVQCHSHPYDPIRHDEYYKFMAFFNNTHDEDTPDDSPVLREFKDEEQKKLENLISWMRASEKPTPNSQNLTTNIQHLIKFQEPKVNPHWGTDFVNGALADAKYLAVRNGGSVNYKQLPIRGKTKLLIAYGHNHDAPTFMEIHRGTQSGDLLTTIKLEKTGGFGWTNNWTIASFDIPPSTKDNEDWHLVFRNSSVKPDQKTCQIGYLMFTNDFPAGDSSEVNYNQFMTLLNTKAETTTPILLENTSNFARKTHVWERGVWTNKADEVQPGIPALFGSLPENSPKNRLGLAKWIASKKNPLTARVAVNRYWEQLFGYGLVETLEDFGSQGFEPTHPELLDYLAVKFVEDFNWQPKEFLKYVVISATYRQDSRITDELQTKDPTNRWLARMPRVRLSAEQVRDQALAISGLLSDKMNGPSVMPSQPDGLWNNPYSGMKWVESEGEDRYRRSLYTFHRRTSPYPSMMTFDGSSREVCSVRRIQTNTPLQALVTLNDPVFVECAVNLAKRSSSKYKTPEQQIDGVYEFALNRKLSEAKKVALLNLYKEAKKEFISCDSCSQKLTAFLPEKPDNYRENKNNIAALAVVANTVMNLDEFIMKE